ncbi:NADP-dependent oxidoreductase [Dawidia soli]|uniref:NADP-dependent oxidoreductase n=1 Tax=Dawidia soli TaxID=2782352 RepID=A0AAP2DGA8_9BACT|nr:NADP-dependent oxidoreductase [Dawidia soli]MBT1690285.1 NADP-dependent oxidoreductase [Dawidia soli]
MKAVTIHEFGGPEVLQVEEVKKPLPRDNEVLIEVHASSLNPVDAKSIEKDSRYRSELHLPTTLGMDVAGVVEMVGDHVKHVKVGDKVFGQASVLRDGSGAFAEYAVTAEDSVARMPESLGFLEAAAVPLAATSAYEAIFEHMKLQKGQRVLIHGGSGGIGSFAIQMARHVGAYVAATASGDGVEFVESLGADEVIDYRKDAFEWSLRNYDAVLDTVGGGIYSQSFHVLKREGIIVSMLMKPDEDRMRQFGVRAVLEMTRIDRRVLSKVAKLIDEGVLKVHISAIYALTEAREAYRAKEEQQILGKIAIDVKQGNYVSG